MSRIFVTRPYLPPLEEYNEILKDIWQNHYLTNMGKYHEIFRSKLKDFFGVANVELFTNGHMSLELSIQALAFPIGAEIITTPFTFVSTTHAIIRNNLTPIFCDINANNYNLDVTKIESLITDKTRAILPVHVYGNICDVEEIASIANKYNLTVIYDAAHAFGETYKGRNVAEFGDVSCFSFHATKTFHTIEGGAACFNDSNLINKLYRLKNFGIRDAEHVDYIGANAKMNEFCAAMGLCNLDHLEEAINGRKVVYERYIDNLRDVEGLKLNFVQKDVESNYSYFPVLFDENVFGASRDRIFEKLANNDVYARKYFYPITNTLDCFNGRFDASKTPVALDISEKVLTLPLYVNLPLEDVDRICHIILNCKN